MKNLTSRYTGFKLLIAGLLISYFVIGLSTEIFLDGKEKNFPPFFSWFLFETVPNKNSKIEYTIRIVEYQGKTIEPPVFYEQAFGIIDNPGSPKSRSLIRTFAYALERKRDDESQRLRRLLEQIYMPGSIKYQVVSVRYDPIKRLTENEYTVKLLGEFTKN